MALVLFEKPLKTVGKIVLNDPDNLNAMSESMALEFLEVIGQIAQEAESLRALVLTGAGRAFSAGGDLKMLEAKTRLSGEENRLSMHKFYNSFLSMLSLKLPIIAAINGHAVGAGLCVACACDIRVASENAKLGFTFTRLGLHPGMGATYFLPRLIGNAAASELLLTARLIEASRARELGLVSQLTSPEKTLETALAIAAEISECGKEASRQLLETLRAAPQTLSAALEREALCQGINYISAEFSEGVKATIEKRKPNF